MREGEGVLHRFKTQGKSRIGVVGLQGSNQVDMFNLIFAAGGPLIEQAANYLDFSHLFYFILFVQISPQLFLFHLKSSEEISCSILPTVFSRCGIFYLPVTSANFGD